VGADAKIREEDMRIRSLLLPLIALSAGAAAPQQAFSTLAECRLDKATARTQLAKVPVIARTPLGGGNTLVTHVPRFVTAFGKPAKAFSVTEMDGGTYFESRTSLAAPYNDMEAALLRAHGLSQCAKRTYDEGLRYCEFTLMPADIGIKLTQARDGTPTATPGVRNWGDLNLSCSY
jgi:hypothetical protein